MNKSIVVFSGGCDSTMVLVEEARKYKDDPNHDVVALSVMHEGVNHSQVEKETQSRKKILDKLSAEGCKVETIEVKVNVSGYDDFNPYEGLAQPCVWLGNVLPYIGSDTDLLFGYIRSDDLFHYKHEFLEALRNMFIINGLQNVNVVFPLEWYTKSMIVKFLIDEDYYNLIWSCGSPEWVAPKDDNPDKGKICACGDCLSCKSIRDALLRLHQAYNYDVTNELAELGFDIEKLATITRTDTEVKLPSFSNYDVLTELDVLNSRKSQLDKIIDSTHDEMIIKMSNVLLSDCNTAIDKLHDKLTMTSKSES